MSLCAGFSGCQLAHLRHLYVSWQHWSVFYEAPLLCHAHSNLGLQGGTCCSSGEIAGVGRVITFSILPSRLEFGYCHKEVVVLTPMFTSLLPHFKKTAIALGTQSFFWCHTGHRKLFHLSDEVSVLLSKTGTLFLCLYQTRYRFNRSISFQQWAVNRGLNQMFLWRL